MRQRSWVLDPAGLAPHRSSNRWAAELGTLMALVAVSLVEFRTTYLLHKDFWSDIVDAAWGVTIGTPHWIEYQNRLLGPWLVRGLAAATGMKFATAFGVAIVLLHIAKNVVLFFLARRLRGNTTEAWHITLFGVLLFVLLQFPKRTYLWDYFDIITFSVFCFGALEERDNRFFLLLFPVAIANRESGLFIALWLIMDALCSKVDGRWQFSWTRNRPRLVLGIGLLIAGAVGIRYVRHRLLVRETAAALFPDFAAERPFHFRENLRVLLGGLRHPDPKLPSLIPLLITLLALAAVMLLPRLDDARAKITALAVVIVMSTYAVGIVSETRVLSTLIPFIVLVPFRRLRPEAASPSPPSLSPR